MTNEDIGRRFNQMASLMEVRGEDPFRLRSYRMAAEAIETWPTPMEEIAREETGSWKFPALARRSPAK